MAIDMEFQTDVIDRLARIEEAIKNDSRALYGNDGKLGLLDRMTSMESQIKSIASERKCNLDWFTRIRESLGWLVTTAIAIYAAFFR